MAMAQQLSSTGNLMQICSDRDLYESRKQESAPAC